MQTHRPFFLLFLHVAILKWKLIKIVKLFGSSSIQLKARKILQRNKSGEERQKQKQRNYICHLHHMCSMASIFIPAAFVAVCETCERLCMYILVRRSFKRLSSSLSILNVFIFLKSCASLQTIKLVLYCIYTFTMHLHCHVENMKVAARKRSTKTTMRRQKC